MFLLEKALEKCIKSWRGSIPLKSSDNQTAQMTVELLDQYRFKRANQNLLVSIALSEATCIRSIGHRLMILYAGMEWASVRVDKEEQVLIRSECGGFPVWVFTASSAGQSNSRQENSTSWIV